MYPYQTLPVGNTEVSVVNVVVIVILILIAIGVVIWIIWDKKRIEKIINEPLEPEDGDEEEWYVPR
jgi:hypothetical protein